MNIVLENGKYLVILGKHLIRLIYKKSDKNDGCNYRNIMLLIRLSSAVDKVLREQQYAFWKGRGCDDQILTLRLIIEKRPDHETLLVLKLTDYEGVFDSANTKAFVKLISLYVISV